MSKGIITCKWWSFVRHQRDLPSVAEGNGTARVFFRGHPVAAFVADGVDIDGASVLALDEAFLSADALVLAALVEHLPQAVGLVVVEASLEHSLHG